MCHNPHYILIVIMLKQLNSLFDEFNIFLSCAGRVMAQSVVVGVLLRRPRLDHGSIHVEFVVDKVGQVFFSENIRIMPSMLHTHISFIHHHHCISFAINSIVKRKFISPLFCRPYADGRLYIKSGDRNAEVGSTAACGMSKRSPEQ